MFCLRKEIQNPPESPYLDWIKSGTKQYEGRLKFKITEWDLYVGKIIEFYDRENPKSYALCEVISLKTFSDFGEAFDTLGEKLIPEHNREEVVQLYNNLFHYENEKFDKNSASWMIVENGVVAIGLKVIDQN